MKQILCILLILVSSISCSGQGNADSVNIQEKLNKLSGEKIIFTTGLSDKFGLPQLPFSIIVPDGYQYEFNNKPVSAIRVYKYEEDSLITEITIGISAFDKEYSIEQEKAWLEEFKRSPEIQRNPNFSIKVYYDYEILGGQRNFYTLMLNNESGKYPIGCPLNSIGLTYPSEDGWFGLSIAVTKWKINSDSPLTEIEKQIINSIRFEKYH